MKELTLFEGLEAKLKENDYMADLAVGWAVPDKIGIKGDRLYYQHLSRGHAGWVERPAPEMLTDFVKLVEAEPEDIAAYAQRWGLLGLCQHGYPYGHAEPGGLEACKLPRSPGEGNAGNYEPLQLWREWSRWIRTLLLVGAQVRHRSRTNDTSTAADWQILSHGFLDGAMRYIKVHGETAAFVITTNHFMWQFAQMHPMLRTIRVAEDAKKPENTEYRFQIRIAGYFKQNGLPGALGLQVLEFITGSSRMAVCTNCGRLYVPTRKPAQGRLNYCPRKECRQRAAWRNAKKLSRGDGSTAVVVFESERMRVPR